MTCPRRWRPPERTASHQYARPSPGDITSSRLKKTSTAFSKRSRLKSAPKKGKASPCPVHHTNGWPRLTIGAAIAIRNRNAMHHSPKTATRFFASCAPTTAQ